MFEQSAEMLLATAEEMANLSSDVEKGLMMYWAVPSRLASASAYVLNPDITTTGNAGKRFRA